MVKNKNLRFLLLLLFGFSAVYLLTMSGAMAGTNPDFLYNKIQDSYKGCYPCTIILFFFDIANVLAGIAFQEFAQPTANLLLVCTALWLAFHTLKFVTSQSPEPTGAFIQSMGTGLFRMLFIWALLTLGSAEVYGNFINPVLKGLMGLTSELSDALAGPATNGQIIPCNYPGGEEVVGLPTQTIATSYPRPLDEEVRKSTYCAMHSIYQNLKTGQMLGQAIRCASEDRLGFWKWKFTHPGVYTQGCIMSFFFWLITIAFPFYLVDTFTRLAFLLAFLPPLLLTWTFPSTRPYTKKGWDLLLHCGFVFLMMALVTGFILVFLRQIIVDPAILNHFKSDDYTMIYEAYTEAEPGGCLMSLAMCFFSFILVGQADSLATHFTGVQLSNVGGQVAGYAAKAAMSAVQTGMKAAAAVATVATGGAAAPLAKGVAAAGKIMSKVMNTAMAKSKAVTKVVKAVQKTAQAVNKVAKAAKKTVGNSKIAKNVVKAANTVQNSKFGQQVAKTGKSIGKTAQKAQKQYKKMDDKYKKFKNTRAGTITSHIGKRITKGGKQAVKNVIDGAISKQTGVEDNPFESSGGSGGSGGGKGEKLSNAPVDKK